jgi:hypothetical protein
MTMLNDIQNIVPVFRAPAVKIFFLRIGSQIDETTFTAS